MKKHVLNYGVVGGVPIAALNLVEYRYLVVEHSGDVYGGVVAIIFAGLGIWLGVRLTATRAEHAAPGGGAPRAEAMRGHPTTDATLGVTPRELEILELIADGLSKWEIADRTFSSENTVKTHLALADRS